MKPIKTFKLLPAIIFTLSTACVSSSPVPPTKDMAITYALIDDLRREDIESYAPDIFREARLFYQQAEREYKRGNTDKAEELRLIAEIRAKTAMHVKRRKILETEVKKLQAEIENAVSIQKQYEEELRKNTLALQQIKDRIAVAKERMRSLAFDSLNKSEEKIEDAETALAQYFSPNLLNQAKQIQKEAQDRLNQGDYEGSLELSKKAMEIADKALNEAKKKLEIRDEILKKGSVIYGVKAEPLEDKVKLTLFELFPPLGTKILFDAYPSLDAIGELFKKHPDIKAFIKGYANESSTESSNLKLAKIRADTIKSYLVSKGVLPERLTTEGLTDTSKEKGKGRHVEIIIEIH